VCVCVERVLLPSTARVQPLCTARTESNKNKSHQPTPTSRDVRSDLPWGRPKICVAAVSQKLLPYNIIVF
jgi:hypothetical protein